MAPRLRTRPSTTDQDARGGQVGQDQPGPQLPPLPRDTVVLLTTARAVVTVPGLRIAPGIVGPGLPAPLLAITVAPVQSWLRSVRPPGWR